MALSIPQGNVPVLVFFEGRTWVINSGLEWDISDVCTAWRRDAGCDVPVAFFSDEALSQQLPKTCIIADALLGSPYPALHVYAAKATNIRVAIFGFEHNCAELELAVVLTSATARREIARTFGVNTDGCQFALDGKEVNEDVPFDEQGLKDGSLLEVDLRVAIDISFDGNIKRVTRLGSHFIADLYQELELTEETVLVAESPYVRIVDGWMFVCDLASNLQELQEPIVLTAEGKTLVSFEPMGFHKLRQKLPIFMSSRPLDVYNLITDRFRLTDFGLTVNGRLLETCLPFRLQITCNDIIQIDFLKAASASHLSSAKKQQTTVEVSINGHSHQCSFDSHKVKFTAIMVKVGKEARISPRLLLHKALFCSGCGRRLSQEEELFQAVPSSCCRIRSLQLSDRKEMASQTQVKQSDVTTSTMCPDSCEMASQTHVEQSDVTTNTMCPEPCAPIPSFSQRLRITTFTSRGSRKNEFASLKSDEKCDVFVAKAAKMAREAPLYPLLFLRKGIFEEGRERVALFCSDRFRYSDGSRAEGDPLREALEILSPSSPLPTCPGAEFEIYVELKTEIFRVTGDRELQQIAPESILDPRFAFLLPGIRSGEKFFWSCGYYFNYFVAAESGREFCRDELPEEQRFVLLMLDDGDLPPKCKDRDGSVLVVFSRSSAPQPQVTGGRVRSLGPVSDDKKHWNFTSPHFREQFTDAAAM